MGHINKNRSIEYIITALIFVLLLLLGLFIFRGCESIDSELMTGEVGEGNTPAPLKIDTKVQIKALAEAEKIRVEKQIKEITDVVVAKKLQEVEKSKQAHKIALLDPKIENTQKALDEAAKVKLENLLKEKVEEVLVEKLNDVKIKVESDKIKIDTLHAEEEGIVKDIQKNHFSKAYVLKGVYFKSSSSQLTEESDRQLDVISKVLISHKDVSIKIQGHTDNRGAYSLNQKISLNRASAVKNALVKRGVSSKRIVIRGKADKLAIADNTSAEGRKQNRRVDMSVLPWIQH